LLIIKSDKQQLVGIREVLSQFFDSTSFSEYEMPH